jgi:hypothetical protein
MTAPRSLGPRSNQMLTSRSERDQATASWQRPLFASMQLRLLAQLCLPEIDAITVGSWRCSPSWRPADRIPRMVIAAADDQGADGVGR